MKKCVECGNELSERAKFCPSCGATVKNESDKERINTDEMRMTSQAQVNVVSLKQKVLGNLVMVGALLMIVGLFVGNFYTTEAGGGYIGVYEIKGFNIPFSGLWYGILLLVSPIVLLISNKVELFKKNEFIWNIGCSIASLLLVFVLKSQIAGAWGHVGSSASLAMGSYIYLLGNLVALALSVLKMLGYKTDAKSLEEAIKNRNIESMK